MFQDYLDRCVVTVNSWMSGFCVDAALVSIIAHSELFSSRYLSCLKKTFLRRVRSIGYDSQFGTRTVIFDAQMEKRTVISDALYEKRSVIFDALSGKRTVISDALVGKANCHL